MPWPDPNRRFEPAEDRALRDELSDLMGLSARPANFFEAKPTPELMALADKLRAEAQRRQRTDRTRPFWTLMAAALPVALVLGGLSVWGHQQKRRADHLAAEVVRKEREVQQADASRQELVRVRQELRAEQDRKDPKTTGAPRRGRELVIPVERNRDRAPTDVTTVKNPR